MSETLIEDRAAPGPDDDEPTLAQGGASVDGAVTSPTDTDDQPEGRFRRAWYRFIGMPVEGWITLFVVGACVTFVWCQLGPHNILANNTPSGGDMGAHVWGPAFLRDHLLPQGRLSGWTPDWYDGFPAYTFYMILPSLLIALLSYVIPYGIAFKLIAVSGVLSLPIAAWAFGRLTRLPFPAPALLAVGATAYLFDRSYSIYGGNIASTLAGEFAFSISLSLAMLFLGVLARGLETGRYRALAAALLAAHGALPPDPGVLRGRRRARAARCSQLDWSAVRWWMWTLLAAAALGIAAARGDGVVDRRTHRPDRAGLALVAVRRVFSPATLALAFVVFCALVVVAAVVLALGSWTGFGARSSTWPSCCRSAR